MVSLSNQVGKQRSQTQDTCFNMMPAIIPSCFSSKGCTILGICAESSSTTLPYYVQQQQAHSNPSKSFLATQHNTTEPHLPTSCLETRQCTNSSFLFKPLLSQLPAKVALCLGPLAFNHLEHQEATLTRILKPMLPLARFSCACTLVVVPREQLLAGQCIITVGAASMSGRI